MKTRTLPRHVLYGSSSCDCADCRPRIKFQNVVPDVVSELITLLVALEDYDSEESKEARRGELESKAPAEIAKMISALNGLPVREIIADARASARQRRNGDEEPVDLPESNPVQLGLKEGGLMPHDEHLPDEVMKFCSRGAGAFEAAQQAHKTWLELKSSTMGRYMTASLSEFLEVETAHLQRAEDRRHERIKLQDRDEHPQIARARKQIVAPQVTMGL